MQSILHSGDLGDIIYGLPVMRRLTNGEPVRIFLCSRPEISKPLTPQRFEAIRALLLAQSYIGEVVMHHGEKVTHDFTGFRACHTRHWTLTEAQAAYICPQKAPDLERPWLVAPKPIQHGRPVFARSPRYHNPDWSYIWRDLMASGLNPMFVGTRAEHEDFSCEFGEIEYFPTPDLLVLANLIAGSSVFIGNQSAPYAVAEGLKHNSIQETHPQIKDCIFPRANGEFVTSANQWYKLKEKGKKSLMLMLQCWSGDVYEALDLTRLICDIEPTMRTDVEFFLMYRRDVNPNAVEDILAIARTKFKTVLSFKGRRRDEGWPAGCNATWQEGMEQAMTFREEGKSKADAVLTFEPDCIPLRPDWLNLLRQAWNQGAGLGRLVVGHEHNEPKTHINGNAIFSIDVLAHHHQLGDSDAGTGWDVYSGKLLLKIGMDTSMISQKYRIKNITVGEVMDIRKNGVVPALFHGIKGRDGREAVRQMMTTGVFRDRIYGVKEAPKVIDKTGKFLISIICFNKVEATKTCIEALLTNSDAQTYSLVIHNNASTDGTKDYLDSLTQAEPSIQVVHNADNLGFIIPNNNAFDFAKKHGFRYFVALNNDTTPPPGWLDALREPLDASENAAISGPSGACHSLDSDMKGMDGGSFEYVEGSCLCASVKVVGKYGSLFAPYLTFMYGEDSDLSLRMRERGHTIHRANFVMPHLRGESRKQPEVIAKCEASEGANHTVLKKRWAHYLKVRHFDFPIVVRRIGAIGDVLLTTPIVRAIKNACPRSQVIVETDTPEIFAYAKTKAVKPANRETDPDELIINLDMAYEDRPMKHIIRAYEEVARESLPALGEVELLTSLPVSDDLTDWARAQRASIAQDKPLLVMHCDKTDWPGKNYPSERFAEIAAWITGQGWSVAVIGRSKPPEVQAADLTGSLSIGQTAAILREADLFLGIDSFPMNAALASGCPTIGLFGCTTPDFIMTDVRSKIGLRSKPGIECAGIRHKKAGVTFVKCSPECIESITVDDIKEAISKLGNLKLA